MSEFLSCDMLFDGDYVPVWESASKVENKSSFAGLSYFNPRHFYP